MKKTILYSAAVLAFILVSCNSSSNKNEQTNSIDSTKSTGVNTSQTFNIDTTKLVSGATFYQCEMNHEVLSDNPGLCPKCGMELAEMKKK